MDIKIVRYGEMGEGLGEGILGGVAEVGKW